MLLMQGIAVGFQKETGGFQKAPGQMAALVTVQQHRWKQRRTDSLLYAPAIKLVRE